MKQLIAKSLIAGSLLLGLGVIACEDARRRDNNELNTTTGTNDYDEGSGAATSSETDTTYRNNMKDTVIMQDNTRTNATDSAGKIR
jgi:hypothetical protein